MLVVVAVTRGSTDGGQMLFGNEVTNLEGKKMDPRSFVTKVSNGLSAREFMEKISSNFHSELAQSRQHLEKHLADSPGIQITSLANKTNAQLDKTANELLKRQLDSSDAKHQDSKLAKKPATKKGQHQHAAKKPTKKSQLASTKQGVQVEPASKLLPAKKGGLAAAKSTATLVHSISGKSDSELDREAEAMMKKLAVSKRASSAPSAR